MFPTVLKSLVCAASVMLPMIIAFGMVSCSQEDDGSKPVPANSNQALLDALNGHIQPVVLGSGNGSQVVIVPELGARVLGMSIAGADDDNLVWVDDSVLDSSIWSKKPMNWNAGGLRSWLAPEDLFFVNENKDADSWFVPEQLDPSPYKLLDRTENKAVLETDMELPSNIGKIYSVTMHRSITLLTEIPAAASASASGVEYMGIEKTHTMTNRGDAVIGEDLPYVCLWSLLQVLPAGTMLIPLKDGADPQTAYREYFNPLGDRLVVQNGVISVKIDGKYRSKIGVRPEAAGAGIAFLRDHGDGSGVLYLKQFPIDPDGIYVDKPWGGDSDYGDVIEMYNDDGNGGGFCELECHGPAKRLAKGDSQSHTLKLHIFRGKISDLKKIGSDLLGADLGQAKYF